MAEVKELRCAICGRAYHPSEIDYTCFDCGEVGTLDVLYDYSALRGQLDRDKLGRSGEMTMWRYREMLPLALESAVPPLAVGWSPLYASPRLASALGVREAWVKDDGQNPTASLKDRASALIVARAMALGFRIVTTASTGNAAAALAGICASVQGVEPIIFVPSSAPEAKIAQLLIYGARVILVESNYDTAFDLCLQISKERGWYCRNTGINPYTTEGKKTVAYEIAEQGAWRSPDVVVVSVGDGNIISGVYKGFWELYQLGWIERIPRLIGVQASGSAALANAWKSQHPPQSIQAIQAQTIADSISADLPRDRAKALRAVRESGGGFITVSDDEIISAIPRLAQLTGVFAEPAAAASFAGAQRAVESKLISPDESVLILITGNGLKDVKRAQSAVKNAIRVEPNLDDVRNALQQIS